MKKLYLPLIVMFLVLGANCLLVCSEVQGQTTTKSKQETKSKRAMVLEKLEESNTPSRQGKYASTPVNKSGAPSTESKHQDVTTDYYPYKIEKFREYESTADQFTPQERAENITALMSEALGFEGNLCLHVYEINLQVAKMHDSIKEKYEGQKGRLNSEKAELDRYRDRLLERVLPEATKRKWLEFKTIDKIKLDEDGYAVETIQMQQRRKMYDF